MKGGLLSSGAAGDPLLAKSGTDVSKLAYAQARVRSGTGTRCLRRRERHGGPADRRRSDRERQAAAAAIALVGGCGLLALRRASSPAGLHLHSSQRGRDLSRNGGVRIARTRAVSFELKPLGRYGLHPTASVECNPRRHRRRAAAPRGTGGETARAATGDVRARAGGQVQLALAVLADGFADQLERLPQSVDDLARVRDAAAAGTTRCPRSTRAWASVTP
jgi:hypothetical protein